MASKPSTSVTSIGSQRDNRYVDTFTDQHKSHRFPNGRPWWGWREFAANKGDRDAFCTPLTPGDHTDPMGSNWTAPWLPEQNGGVRTFYEFNYLRNRITIRYDVIKGHDAQAEAVYYQAAAKLAYDMNSEAPAVGTMPKHGIRAIIGDPPRSPKVATAAMAGDPWLLGQSDEVNVELARLLGINGHGLTLEPQTGIVQPGAVLSATGDLEARIAAAVAAALAAERAKAADRKRASRAKTKGAAA